MDFSGDEIFNLLQGSEKKSWFQHAICIPAIVSIQNAEILKMGQSTMKYTAGKPPMLFYGWKRRRKA